MSGLAHYLENEGIPTTLIALVREHVKKMKPPRALAVPFELGRPFGAPNNPEFQRRVLSDVLGLLERNDGPILEDFPDQPPGVSSSDEPEEGWACPINLAPPMDNLSDSEKLIAGLKQEFALLRPWHDESVKSQNGRTMVGVTEMPPEDIPEFLVNFIDTPDMDSPLKDEDLPMAIKRTVDDIRYFYYEAALARPGNATDIEVANWFWGETLIGKVVLMVRDTCLEQEGKMMQALGNLMLVPHHQKHRSAKD